MADVKPTLPKPPTQPEDEQLSVAPTFDRNQPWAVKIPKFLQEKWEQIKEEGGFDVCHDIIRLWQKRERDRGGL
jgi:hypothetical protein